MLHQTRWRIWDCNILAGLLLTTKAVTRAIGNIRSRCPIPRCTERNERKRGDGREEEINPIFTLECKQIFSGEGKEREVFIFTTCEVEICKSPHLNRIQACLTCHFGHLKLSDSGAFYRMLPVRMSRRRNSTGCDPGKSDFKTSVSTLTDCGIWGKTSEARLNFLSCKMGISTIRWQVFESSKSEITNIKLLGAQ